MAGAAASRTPWHLWVVGVLAVIWASVPTYDWVMFKLEDADFLAGLPADWKAAVLEQPLWVEVVWFFAIWGAVAGAVLLFARRRWAWPAFAVSAIALAVDQAYVVFMTTFGFSPQVLVLLIISALFALYAWWMAKRGVLR